MNFRHLAGALALSAAALAAVACGDDKPPTTPTPAPTPPPPAAAPVLTAPKVDAPAENDQLQTLRPSLRVMNATADQAGARTYEFQISDDPDFAPASAGISRYYKVVLTQANVAEGGDGRTTFDAPADLQPTTRFYWRARARQGTTDGPFSATSTFRTKIQGYNRPGELFDPLTNGSTIGAVVNNVTLTPGRGATINTNESHIRYQLAQMLTVGEFSFEADGIHNDTPGDKTKMMSMYDGNGDIITSDYRATIEKRDGGVVAWRFIAGEAESDAQIDTGSSERVGINFDPAQTYVWRIKWGNNFFNLEIFRGAAMTDRVYDFGKPYAGTYDPNPHICYLGAPIGRSGAESASVVGATWRNVFIGNGARPRPTSIGTATIENPADDPRIKNRGIRLR